jgi:5,10-methylenetetrahydromethanopterin reductase
MPVDVRAANVPGGPFDVGVVGQPAGEAVELAVEAERLGFGGVWVADSQSVFRDAFVLLGLCAARTERIALATGVTNPVTRHPAQLASAFATVGEQAPGRVIAGIGKGESAVHTLGLRPATVARLEEAVVALRSLVRGRPARWDGVETRVRWAGTEVPVVVAASGPRSLRLAGRVADGVLFQVGAEPALVRWALGHVEAGARESGRSLDDLTLCMRIGCAVADDPERAREAVRPYASAAAKTIFDSVPAEDLPPHLVEEVRELRREYDYREHAQEQARHRRFLTGPLLDAVAIAGTPDEAVERLRRVIGLGPDRIVLTFAAGDALTIAEALGERVLPVLR